MRGAGGRVADSRGLRGALIVFGVAILIRVVFLAAISRTACLDINLDPISDMETFHRWALSIVGGDWLGRSDFHPYHPWQAAVAAPEQWAAWYGHVYHQEPFYPYLVALVYLLAPHQPFSVILLQMVLGAAGCAATYLAARVVVPDRAAIAAGAIACLYGPFLYYDCLVLRDSVLVPIGAFLIWTAVEARARPGAAARGWWIAFGVLSGIAFVTKASILPFVAIVTGLAVMGGRRSALRARIGPAALIAGGFVLALIPVVARNVIVGAPPLKTTTRGPIELINGNNPWHPGIGWFDGDDRRVSAYAREILAKADGRLLPTALAVARSWSADPVGLARLQIVKAGYMLAPYEMPNNASYSYFRENSSLLRFGALTFFWVSPLALAGIAASWRWRRGLAPVAWYLLSGFLFTVAFYVIARFRAPLMPAVIIYAGLGLWSIVEAIEGRRAARAAALLCLVGAGVAANGMANFPDRDLVRPQDYLIAIEGYRSRGMADRALAEAGTARDRFPGFPHFHRLAGGILADLGRVDEAIEAFREAIARDPADAETRRRLVELERTRDP